MTGRALFAIFALGSLGLINWWAGHFDRSAMFCAAQFIVHGLAPRRDRA